MEIRCLRCKQEFQIGKEQLKKIEEIRIGKMKPKDYLRFFPLISGECKDNKGHDFVFTDAFLDQNKKVIQKYVGKQADIAMLKTSIEMNEGKEKELLAEKEKLTARLDQIRDETYAVETGWMDLTSMQMPNSVVSLKDTLDEFEDITGTRDIDLWKDEIIPQK